MAQGRGGLRCRILTGGELSLGEKIINRRRIVKLPPAVPVSEVRALLESILVRPETICLPLDEAGKILAKPIAADRDGPPYDRVMMDGYALRSGFEARWLRTGRNKRSQLHS